MNTKTILYILLFAGAVLTTSCFKEYLDPVPKRSISDLTAFDTKPRIDGQVNALYTAIRSGNFLGGRYLVYGDIRANDFLNATTNGVTGYGIWNHTIGGDDSRVSDPWSAAYAAINRINVFLEGLEASNAVSKGIITQQVYDQYRGEALAIRAVTYFYLLQLYAQPYNKDNGASPGLPLRLKAQRSSADNDLARSTVAEVYTQILLDLNTAESIVATTHSSDLLNVIRIHKNTIIAFKTRVYLHMGNYPAVLTEGNKIVPASAPFVAASGVPHALASTIASVFAPPYTTKESIFSIPFTPTELPGTQNGLGSYYNPGPRGLGDYYINPDGIWGNTTQFPLTDARRSFQVSSGTPARLFLQKWPLSPHTDYAPIMRYAEVLLNVAEAEAYVNNGANARSVALLNAVHGRSDATISWVVGDFANRDAFVAVVMTERNIEFFGEGLRNMDIMRKVATIPGKAEISSVPPTAQAYIWPMPISELTTNKLCIDN